MMAVLLSGEGMASSLSSEASSMRFAAPSRCRTGWSSVMLASRPSAASSSGNIAARLEGIAKPGAICLSEDAYRQVKSRLDLAVRDLGTTQLKNIAEPVRGYSVEGGKPASLKPGKPAQRNFLMPIVAPLLALIVIAGVTLYFASGPKSGAARTTQPITASTAPEPVKQVAPEPPKVTERLSIVVLPFTNLGGDPSQDYLADVITEELTSSLSRIAGSF